MPHLMTHSELDSQDLVVLRDLVRFGVLAADQIARRYGDPSLAALRIPFLHDGRVILRWRDTLDGAHVYSPTNLGKHLSHVEVDPLTMAPVSPLITRLAV